MNRKGYTENVLPINGDIAIKAGEILRQSSVDVPLIIVTDSMRLSVWLSHAPRNGHSSVRGFIEYADL
jgi:hypothetical protein